LIAQNLPFITVVEENHNLGVMGCKKPPWKILDKKQKMHILLILNAQFINCS